MYTASYPYLYSESRDNNSESLYKSGQGFFGIQYDWKGGNFFATATLCSEQ